MLDFRPQEGQISLQGTRFVLINSSALGILRRDLIKTLGFERAKGFLTRFGWTCGQEDAKLIKKNFSLKKEDISTAGAIFHTLVGHTHVSPLEVKDDNVEEWFMEGIWTNSYEAEQHLNYFAHADSPVCWTLVGYAGGFRSAFQEQRVIYKELECVGRGDSRCRFIGKPIADWGKEIASELPYYEESKIVEELDAAYAKIKSQHDIVARSVEVHEELIKLVLKGENISSISSALGALTQSTAIVVDQFYHSLIPKEPVNQKLAENKIERSDIKKLFESSRWSSKRKQLLTERRPVLFAAKDQEKVYVITPIVSGSNILGFIILIKEKTKLSDIEFMASEQAATIFALKLMQDTAVAETENRLRGSFVHDLIEGRYGNAEAIITRARSFDFDLLLPHHVFYIQSDIWQEPKIHEIAYDNLRQQMISTVKRLTEDQTMQCLAAAGHGGIIVLAAISSNLLADSIQLGNKLQKNLSKTFSDELFYIGIGRNCQNPEEYRQSYKEAQKAVMISKSLKSSEGVIAFESLGVYSLLFNVENKNELHQFAMDRLGNLHAFDLKNSNALVQTLETYLENNCNLAQTARALSLTVNGLRYRLTRLQEIGDIDLEDNRQRFDLQLALKLLRVMELDE